MESATPTIMRVVFVELSDRVVIVSASAFFVAGSLISLNSSTTRMEGLDSTPIVWRTFSACGLASSHESRVSSLSSYSTANSRNRIIRFAKHGNEKIKDGGGQ